MPHRFVLAPWKQYVYKVDGCTPAEFPFSFKGLPNPRKDDLFILCKKKKEVFSGSLALLHLFIYLFYNSYGFCSVFNGSIRTTFTRMELACFLKKLKLKHLAGLFQLHPGRTRHGEYLLQHSVTHKERPLLMSQEGRREKKIYYRCGD